MYRLYCIVLTFIPWKYNSTSLGGLNAEKARLSIADTGEFIDLAEKANSELVKKSHFAQVIAMLPPRFTVQKIQKIFTTKQHGYSISSGKIFWT